MSPLLIALAVGVIAYILFIIAVPKAVPKASDDFVRAALDRLIEENQAADIARHDVLRDQLEHAPPFIRSLFSLGFMRPIYEAALQAGLRNDMQQVLSFMLMTFGISAALLFAAGLGLLAFPLAVVFAYLVPIYHYKQKRAKRNTKFIDQFPDALDMIVRSVRSGFPISVGLQLLAENAEEPVRSEFRQVADEMALGRSLSEALARLSSRIDEPDVRFFVVVLTLQQETGGNLAEVIGNLSSIIRKRKQIRHKIRAMTAEGKATGVILGMLPILVFGALFVVQPRYLDAFFHDPLGMKFFASAIAMLIACFFIVRHMIKVEI